MPGPELCRALIKTHHMTSRKKIMAISKATKQYSLRCLRVMVGGCDGEDGKGSLKEWVRSIKFGIFLFLLPSPGFC